MTASTNQNIPLTVAPAGDTPRKQADAINQHATLIGSGLLQPRTVAQLALETKERGRQFYCTNESGGEVPVYCDSAGNWRRCTDRAIAS